MNVKICKKCGIEKPSTSEYYPVRKDSPDGLRNECRECTKDFQKTYRAKNKDKSKEYQSQYYDKNKNFLLDYQKRYYKENKEEVIKYQRQYYEENKQEIIEKQRAYYLKNINNKKAYDKLYKEKNRFKLKKQRKLYKLSNRDYFNIQNQSRRARIKELEATFTEYDWEVALNHFNKSCAYCGVKQETHIKHKNQRLHQDHFIPLSKGGTYTVDNIVPACGNCNPSKGDRDFFEWYPQKDFYNKDREDKIINYLNTMKQN